ncbi:MAG TPA: DUF1254 domain-containing protein [Rhizomicrobium sp.]
MSSSAQANPATRVTPDNFIRAESNRYFGAVVKQGGFGKLFHRREPSPIDDQDVVRMNRDTLYSSIVVDLDAGPVTITLPDSSGRFMSMQVFDEDEYVTEVAYDARPRSYSKEKIGTRYIMVGFRTLVNPEDAEDLKKVHALQDAIKVEQKSPGKFEIPDWDAQSQKKVRDALVTLNETLSDSQHMFGSKSEVDPVRRLIGAAAMWGGNPEKDAIYLPITPSRNDGKTIYCLTVKDVPVDGFWSVIVYDKDGYIPKNEHNIYSLNNITAKKDADGSVTVQFGGFDGKTPNCIPIVPGWNYLVRLYRPREEVLSGKWKFPEARPVS